LTPLYGATDDSSGDELRDERRTMVKYRRESIQYQAHPLGVKRLVAFLLHPAAPYLVARVSDPVRNRARAQSRHSRIQRRFGELEPQHTPPRRRPRVVVGRNELRQRDARCDDPWRLRWRCCHWRQAPAATTGANGLNTGGLRRAMARSQRSAFCVDSRNTPRHECFCAEVLAIVLSGNKQLRNALIEPESA